MKDFLVETLTPLPFQGGNALCILQVGYKEVSFTTFQGLLHLRQIVSIRPVGGHHGVMVGNRGAEFGAWFETEGIRSMRQT